MASSTGTVRTEVFGRKTLFPAQVPIRDRGVGAGNADL
jgi:hypothetical protein